MKLKYLIISGVVLLLYLAKKKKDEVKKKTEVEKALEENKPQSEEQLDNLRIRLFDWLSDNMVYMDDDSKWDIVAYITENLDENLNEVQELVDNE